jgi:hypothetical protein
MQFCVCLLTHLVAADKYDLTTLKSLFSGAAPLSGSLVMAVKQRLKARGGDVTISQGNVSLHPTFSYLCSIFYLF